MINSRDYFRARVIIQNKRFRIKVSPIYINMYQELNELYKPIEKKQPVTTAVGRSTVTMIEDSPNDDFLYELSRETIRVTGSEKEDGKRLQTPIFYMATCIEMAGILSVDGEFALDEITDIITIYEMIQAFKRHVGRQEMIEVNRPDDEKSEIEHLYSLDELITPVAKDFRRNYVGSYEKHKDFVLKQMDATKGRHKSRYERYQDHTKNNPVRDHSPSFTTVPGETPYERSRRIRAGGDIRFVGEDK